MGLTDKSSARGIGLNHTLIYQVHLFLSNSDVLQEHAKSLVLLLVKLLREQAQVSICLHGGEALRLPPALHRRIRGRRNAGPLFPKLSRFDSAT